MERIVFKKTMRLLLAHRPTVETMPDRNTELPIFDKIIRC